MECKESLEEKELNTRYEVNGKPLSMMMEALMKDITKKEYIDGLKNNFSFNLFDNKVFLEETEKLAGKVITKKSLILVGDNVLTKRLGFEINVDKWKEEMQIREIYSPIIEELITMDKEKIITIIQNFCKVAGMQQPQLQIEHLYVDNSDKVDESMYKINVINPINGEVTTIIDNGIIVI